LRAKTITWKLKNQCCGVARHGASRIRKAILLFKAVRLIESRNKLCKQPTSPRSK
jgi:hypothetical protein